MIMEVRREIGKVDKIEDDPSFTRKRFRTNNKELGSWFQYVVVAVVAITVWFWRDIGAQNWLGKIGSVFLIMFIYLLTYLFPVYWLAQLKQGGKNK